MNNSKRVLSLVVGASAALAAGTLGATSAKAQLTNMLQSGIQRPTAGVTIGQTTMAKGTIQYTNSAGTNDNFSVGTSTSIAANASASSTSDYSVTSVASFDMGNNNIDGPGGLSIIQQQIGKSQNSGKKDSLTTDVKTQLAQSATTSALEQTNSGFRALDASGAALDASVLDSVDFTEEDATKLTTAMNSAGIAKIQQFVGSSYQDVDSDKIQSVYTSAFSQNYERNFSEAAAKSSFEAEGSGIIKGTFKKDAGESSTSNTETVVQTNKGTGAIVNSTDFNEVKMTGALQTALDNFEADPTKNTFVTEAGATITIDQDMFDKLDGTAVGESYGVNLTNNSTFDLDTQVTQNSTFKQVSPTTNEVTVEGINSENVIVSDDSAEFSSNITRDITATTVSSGTASGSATGTVTTTATANASSSSFINSFAQAY
jgi:hypothetical protein